MVQVFNSKIAFLSPQETTDFATHLSSLLHPGDVILLEGGIGAGKTHFARSLIQHRLAQADRFEDVPSPTFTLVQTYDDGTTEIWHADLYRLTHPDEVEELGLVDAFDQAICLIEWPDRLGELAPPNALHLSFTVHDTPERRSIEISGTESVWGNRMRKILS